MFIHGSMLEWPEPSSGQGPYAHQDGKMSLFIICADSTKGSANCLGGGSTGVDGDTEILGPLDDGEEILDIGRPPTSCR